MKRIMMVLSKRLLEKELDPFKSDPVLDLINKVLLEDRSPQILEGMEGVIFYHDLDSFEIGDVMKILPPEIFRIRIQPINRHNVDILGIRVVPTMKEAVIQMKQKLN